MIKIILLFVSIIFFINSILYAQSLQESTQKAINYSHAMAHKMAQSLIEQDLSLLVDKLILTGTNFENNKLKNTKETLSKLNQSLLELLSEVESIKAIDTETLLKIENTYRSLVRERFKTSFDAQEIIYQQQMMLPLLKEPLNNFSQICRVGRSHIGLIPSPLQLPRLPQNEYTLTFGFKFNSNGDQDGPASLNFYATNPTQNNTEANTLNSFLSLGTSLSYQVAYHGTSAASVAIANAMAPYFAVALLAVNAMIFLSNNQDEINRKNDEAQAQNTVYLKSASDQDVAKYYKELCKPIITQFESLTNKMELFISSDRDRLPLIDEINESKSSRVLYLTEANSKKILWSRNILQLYYYAKTNFCHRDQNPRFCDSKEGHYYLIEQPDIQLSMTNLETDESLIKAQYNLSEFNTKYPQKEIVNWVTLEILEVMYLKWSTLSAQIANISFRQADQAMRAIQKQIRSFINQIESIKDSQWSNNKTPLNLNQKYQSQFFELRQEVFDLLRIAIKVFLNNHNPVSAKKQFSTFEIKFQKFALKTLANPDIREMNNLVLKMKEFYDTL